MTVPACSAAKPAETEPALLEIADGVYAFEQLPGGWCLNNAGLVAGGTRSVLIDTAATEARARLLRSEVERVVPGGPDVVINTHFHGDHVFGNAVFGPESLVIAHQGTHDDMAEAGLALRGLWPTVDWGDTGLRLPDLTFRDSLTLRAGELTVELFRVGPAHTADDVVAWVPEQRVLFTGDVAWSGVTPYVLMGSVGGSLRALGQLRALDPRIVVPGHGPVGGPEVLDGTEAYLRLLRDLAEDGLAAGVSALEAARTADLGEFADLVDSERLVGNLHRAYAELRGLAPGARIDVAESFREMVEFHGGLPQCHA
jgi:cyclase